MIRIATRHREFPVSWPWRSALARAAVLRAALATMLLFLTGTAGYGQLFSLKTLPGEPSPCGFAGSLPGTPISADLSSRAVVDSLLAASSQAAILGEYASARTYLEEAARADPSNPVVVYRLARTFEDEGDVTGAVREYCRLLALAPSDPDARIARERISALAARASEGVPRDPWAVAIDEGVEAYSAGRIRDAVDAFTRAIELRPDDGTGYFNRGVAFHSDGRPEIAINDFERYIALDPSAADRAEVVTEVRNLRMLAGLPSTAPVPGRAQPTTVLAQGLVVPGLGQHATGRTGLGFAVLAAAGGAIYYGARQQVVNRREGAYDPFGNYYEYDVRTVDRPNLTTGLAAAGVIAVAAAIESYLYARRNEFESVPVARGTADTTASLRSCAAPESAASPAPTLFPRFPTRGCGLSPERGLAFLTPTDSAASAPYLPGRQPLTSNHQR